MYAAAEVHHEAIQLLPEESFRLLRWTDSTAAVDLIGSDGSIHPQPGAGERWHCHPEVELVLTTSGSGTSFIGDHIDSYQAPELVLLGSELPHCWSAAGGSSGICLQFSADPGHVLWQCPEAQALGALFDRARRGLRFSGQAATEVAAVMQAMVGLTGLGRLASFFTVLNLLAHGAETEPLSQQLYLPGRLRGHEGIKAVIVHILDHFSSELELEDMITIADTSKASFCRHFKNLTGRSFGRFLTEVRLNHICRRLLESDRSISNIVFEAGFNNLSHFNHQFRERYGMSPTAYRAAGGK